MLATPIQIVCYVAAIGNGGTLYRPQLVDRVENAEGEVVMQFEPEAQGTLPVSPETLEAIHEAMVGVVRDPRATAYRRFLGLHDIDIAGKTGTAEVSNSPPHAWVIGFGPVQPEEGQRSIALAVVVEAGGDFGESATGGSVAAPIASELLKLYLAGA